LSDSLFLGADFAGIIESVGKNVTKYKAGDEIFGDVSASGSGGFTEYTCVRENRVAIKPENLSFEEAAAVPLAAVTALQGLRNQGEIKAGQQVLINGASGGVGTFAVQIAKSFNTEVTAVCSTRNVEMVRSIGADHVIDYTKKDFTKNQTCYDLILAANGNSSIFGYIRSLKPKGNLVVSGGTMSQFLRSALLGPWIGKKDSKKVKGFIAQPNQQDLIFMSELLESGKIKPVIDRCYPLKEVPDAIRYLENEHAQGKVVITMNKE